MGEFSIYEFNSGSGVNPFEALSVEMGFRGGAISYRIILEGGRYDLTNLEVVQHKTDANSVVSCILDIIYNLSNQINEKSKYLFIISKYKGTLKSLTSAKSILVTFEKTQDDELLLNILAQQTACEDTIEIDLSDLEYIHGDEKSGYLHNIKIIIEALISEHISDLLDAIACTLPDPVSVGNHLVLSIYNLS